MVVLGHSRPSENSMEMSPSPILPVLVPTQSPGVPPCPADIPVPAIVARASGGRGRFAGDEFFAGGISDAHTRKNYRHAVLQFLA